MLHAIYERNEFNARGFRAAWLPDGSGYTVLESPPGDRAGGNSREIIRYEAASGARTVLASSAQLTPPGGQSPVSIDGYAISPDGGQILVETNGRADRDTDRRIADLWTLDKSSGALRKVIEGVAPGIGRNAFSPDGRRILCTIQANLHVCDLSAGSSGPTIPLTFKGIAGTVMNGQASWSPDGRTVAFVQTDSSALLQRPILVPTDPSYPEVRYVRFAWASSPPAEARRAGFRSPQLRPDSISER